MQRFKNIYQDFVSGEANTYHWTVGRKIATSLSGFVAGFFAGLLAAWIMQNSTADSFDKLK
ncbi:MAG: hypothetical protein A3A97_04825 [Candidatus Terrybacteria bacterium RIFCSPLOWO2_01_FULL_40_23]|uniref:Uncharacterized protein n=1 Tax=Candidatus Terrybacteria bacterium RIFCSPLOWO2_01_FULL_40_23 TaxID=1802366 RepID=A0A1G2PX62_9BACT|nr:MAG: hypothetical protein A3A97_04825 [Candidatus Terrybacteria bacterium RIFCSPLOWO2_01_FULL_40_23]